MSWWAWFLVIAGALTAALITLICVAFLWELFTSVRMSRDQAAWRQQQVKRNEAGVALLRRWLSSEQRRQLDDLGWFDVIGSHSGRSYRIASRSSVRGTTAEGVLMFLCFAPHGCCAYGDVMLAQKIALESDEEAVLKIAGLVVRTAGP